MSEPLTLPRTRITRICEQFAVKYLAVFGSAVTDHFDPLSSDVDFLVEFTDGAKTLDNYFGFKHALEDLLGRPVDLVAPKALRNPYFAATVSETRQDLYAAA